MSIKKFATLTAVIAFAFSASVHAQSFPDRPVTIVVPFAPGGGVDTVARLIAPEMSKKLGQPVIIENRAGAAGQIGADYVARRAKGDGYTLLLGSPGATTAGAALNPDLPYSPLEDFEAVSQVVTIPNLLVARKDFPASTAKELVEYASSGNSVNYGSGGVGTSQHLAGELLSKSIGSDLLHVPYKGTAPALNAVLAGQIDLSIADPSAAQYVQTGQLKLLGVTTSNRSKALPDFPTLSEAGIEGYSAGNWYGMLAPKETSKDRVDLLNEAIRFALENPAVQEKLLVLGMDPSPSTPEELHSFLVDDSALWKNLVDEIGLKLN